MTVLGNYGMEDGGIPVEQRRAIWCQAVKLLWFVTFFTEGDRAGSGFACCLFFICWSIFAGFLCNFSDNAEKWFRDRLYHAVTQIGIEK